MKSFIQFLTEVNLGSYTDPRIFDLKRKLVDDMLENSPHKFFFNTMHNITIRSVSIDLRWKIVVSIDNDYTTEIDGGAKLSYDSSDSETLFTITLFCDRNRSNATSKKEKDIEKLQLHVEQFCFLSLQSICTVNKRGVHFAKFSIHEALPPHHNMASLILLYQGIIKSVN